jgi:hypothetical protein
MRETAKNRVNVLFFYDGDEEYARPVSLLWRGREYTLGPVKFWHTTHPEGQLVHHYTVDDQSGDFTFQLALETENLTWRLERCTLSEDAAEAGTYARGSLPQAV